MKLYEITDQRRQALAELDDMDLPADVVADTLEGLTGTFVEKAKDVAAYILNMDADVQAMDFYIERMVAKRDATKRRKEWGIEYLHTNMIASDITEIKGPEFTLRVRQNPVKVMVDDADSIPADYQVEIPATTRLDKKLVKKAIEDGFDVPGAHLERGTRLDIK